MANPVGRPTDYRPEYCQKLIKHMSEGLSFESFAAEVDTWKSVLYGWVEMFPEFSDAKKAGTEKCRRFWEKLSTDYVLNITEANKSSKSLNTGVWIFNMKNRFPDEWRDRQELNVDVKPFSFAYEPKSKRSKED